MKAPKCVRDKGRALEKFPHKIQSSHTAGMKKPHFISPTAKDRQLLEQVPRVYTFLCARRKQGDAKEEEEVKGNIWCITSAPGLLTVGNH